MKFLTSDWHLGHHKIIQLCNRPFENIDEMDSAIIDQTNAMVGKNDEIIMLGDFTMRPMNIVHSYVHRIKCKNVSFVLGNHDNKNHIKNFFRVYDLFTIKNPDIVCCHYAMAKWNKSHYGAYHAYGHSHSRAEDELDRAFPGRRSMDVGIDNIFKLYGYYGPISVDKFIERLEPMKGYMNQC